MSARLFHFEFRGERGRQPFGAGEDPVGEALEELRGFTGGITPEGSYRLIEARGPVPTWRSLEVGADGRIIGG